MRQTKFLIAFAILLLAAGISSCKKNNITTSSETQTTIALSTDQAISDNLNSDAENVLNEAAVQNNFSGNTPVSVTTTMNVLSCATVTVTPRTRISQKHHY